MTSFITVSTGANPFDTPDNRGSIDEKEKYHEQIIVSSRPLRRKKFKNQRLNVEYEKPWLLEKDPRAKLPNMIFYGGMVVAVAIGVVLIYRSYKSVVNSDYCLAFEDSFQTLDPANWNHEVQIDGFGVRSFEWTTTDERNSYTDEKGLHIVPTLTTDDTDITIEQLYNGYTLNLTKDGTCTSDVSNGTCAIISNFTSGDTIPPVRSARLTTEGKHAIKYGRVEVTAKIGKGDWLWPAIWMMPANGGAYGAWPKSGEIDIAEFRGNGAEAYKGGGINAMRSTLHWGPTSDTDHYWQTTGVRTLKRTDYSEGFNTFGFEWAPSYLFFYLNSRLNAVYNLKFPKGSRMWQRGGFGSLYANGSEADTWSPTGNPNTPFDQEFYLILNVAVGARNGFFKDGVDGKPWLDGADSAVRNFAEANATWYPTWDPEGMTVKSVKMWSLGKCGTTLA